MNNIVDDVKADKAEIELLAEAHDESTGLSWLWAFLFGPIYYWVNGFVGIGFLILILNFLVIGFIVSPIIVYPVWRSRARKKAEQLHAISRASRNR